MLQQQSAKLITLLLFGIAPAILAAQVCAQISPGKLSSYHQALEGITNCTKCHELGEAVTNENCLVCHLAIADRLTQGSGYHTSAEVTGNDCSSCHREHNGREFELVHWKEGRDRFDHATTGYQLEGAHARQECRRCHQQSYIQSSRFAGDANVNPARTYLGLDSRCLSCHADEHLDQLTDDCLTCHSYTTWRPAERFDHHQAAYQLTGKHREVTCDKCHPAQEKPVPFISGDRIQTRPEQGLYTLYQGLNYSRCTACHTDVHTGKFGANCSECHTTDGFRTAGKSGRFDHQRTAFPLSGRHAAVACGQCHTSGNMTDPLRHEQCRDCHSDPHLNQFISRSDGGACESCHTDAGFLPSTYGFEAHQNSDYALSGSHLAVPCNQCHTSVSGADDQIYTRFDLEHDDCRACHRDVHQGQLDIWLDKGGCSYCHSTETWRQTSFDHSLARFNLDGKHREVLCLECHYLEDDAGGRQVWMKPIDMNCAGCHPDVHQGQFLRTGEASVSCDKCHLSSGWKDLVFTHNRDARFILDGAHERLACSECHTPTLLNGQTVIRYRPLGSACQDCHQESKKGTGYHN